MKAGDPVLVVEGRWAGQAGRVATPGKVMFREHTIPVSVRGAPSVWFLPGELRAISEEELLVREVMGS